MVPLINTSSRQYCTSVVGSGQSDGFIEAALNRYTVCAWVCVFACVRIYMYVCVYVFMYVCVCMYVVYVCMYVYMYDVCIYV